MKQRKIKSVPPSFLHVTALVSNFYGPLKSLSKKTQKLITDYKTRDFEYISYKDYKAIFASLERINEELTKCCHKASLLVDTQKRDAQVNQGECQINDVIADIVRLLSNQMSVKSIAVKMRLAKQMPLVKLGPVEGHQIINNIIVNAIQAMPGGGKISIVTKFNATTKCVDIEINDTGIGMSKEEMSNAFEPFFSTKSAHVEKAAGLGLSVVHSITQSIGGQVHLQSSLRKGTNVHLSLPIVS